MLLDILNFDEADGGGYTELPGSTSNLFLGTTDPSGQQFSISNAISNDGNLIAAGGPYWRSSSVNYYTSSGNPTATGKVELLRWDPSVPEWTTNKVGVILASSLGGGSTVGDKLSEIKGTHISSYTDILDGSVIADASNNEFGFSVDLAENILIVGAPSKDNTAENQGAIYLYKCDYSIAKTTANENAGKYPIDLLSYIEFDDSNNNDLEFGQSVAISQDATTIAVGAPKVNGGIVKIYTVPTKETIEYDVGPVNDNGVEKIGIALKGEPLELLDTLADANRPLLIVGNKYIFHIGSFSTGSGSQNIDIEFGVNKDNYTGNSPAEKYEIGVVKTFDSGGILEKIEFDFTEGFAVYKEKIQKLYIWDDGRDNQASTKYLNVSLPTIVQVGNDISVNASTNDYFGSSVKLTNDGKQIIIGGPQTLVTDESNDRDKGYAMVFRYSTYTNDWENISGPFVDSNSNSTISNSGTIDDNYLNYDSVNDILIYGLVSPEEKALEPFSRNNLPAYNSNFKVKVANKNRKV